MKKTAMLLLALIVSTLAFAQSTITGTVTDAYGDGVIGARVAAVGHENVFTATDMDGNYTLKVPAGTKQIQVSYIGLATAVVDIKNQSVINVTMREDNNVLDEVVVVGYGTMKKSDLSGSSSSINEQSLKQTIVSSLDQQLQGKATGVTAVQTSGAPGSASSIRVRGIGSINSNQEPLYVVDGVILQGSAQKGSELGLGEKLGNGKVSTVSPLSTINPSDIVSMEILKDASACAIYGAQGANGVVLITTKRGKAGEAKFNYDGMMAVNRQMKRLDMMNLREYAQYYNEFVDAGYVQGEAINHKYSDPSILGKGTNWQDAVFRTAIQQQHQISAEGGTDAVRYYVSGNIMNQEGTIIGTEFNRYSFRANLDAQLKPWLKLGLSATYSNTRDDLQRADGAEGVIGYSLFTLPDTPIYEIDGSYAVNLPDGWTNPNPIALAKSYEYTLKRQKLAGNVFADVTPMKNLVWHAELGYDISSSNATTFEPTIDLGGWKKPTNENRWQKNSNKFWQLKNYVTYTGKIDRHNYTAMVGQECWESLWDGISVFNTNLPLDEIHSPALGQGKPEIGSFFGSASMASFFTRETYNYDERYYVTYTYRYDGSSNFGPRNRWAGFHSFAASWRFTNEKFMEATKNWLSNGKLRAGWGQTGNSNIGGYLWGAALEKMSTGLGKSYRPNQLPNESIQWETQEQMDFGIDLGFLNNRINLTLDWYQKDSKNMLMSMPLPTYMGTGGNGSSRLKAPKGNFGHMRNSGFEIELRTTPVQTKNFSWDSDLQFSFNKNKLIALQNSSAAALQGKGQWSDVVALSEVGGSMYNFYGYVVEGVYKDFDDILNSPVNTLVNGSTFVKNDDGTYSHVTDPSAYNKNSTVWPGDLKFKDVNGDGRIDAADKTNIGSPLPKCTFGWSNTFRYKNFDMSIFINGSLGNKVMNYTSINLTSMSNLWYNQINNQIEDRAVIAAIDPTKVYESGAWYDDVTNVHVTNPDTKTPRAAWGNTYNQNISDRYIENGSYVRLKNISLGYTLPKKLVKKALLTNARVYANIQNLLTITGYKGYDPEIGASTTDSDGYVFGLDNGRYPSPTTYSFGINLSF